MLTGTPNLAATARLPSGRFETTPCSAPCFGRRGHADELRRRIHPQHIARVSQGRRGHLQVGLIAIATSLVVAVINTAILVYRTPYLQRAVGLYVELARNTPLLIQLFSCTSRCPAWA